MITLPHINEESQIAVAQAVVKVKLGADGVPKETFL